jgi:hypothetical protein
MTDSDHDLERALADLRPRPPGPALTAALAFGLFLGAAPEEGAPAYQLVRAEQSPVEIEVLRPVRLEDGSFARPVRARWENTTQWEDPRTRTRFINYRPSEQTTLLPLETY